MKNKKIIFGFSLLGVFAYSALSCGRGIMHTPSSDLAAYKADTIGHDGVPEPELLTWADSYDKLIKEANSISDLNDVADKFHIAEDDPNRTSLARYEILHEAEELLMRSGAIIPLYNYHDPYLIKPEIEGLYWCPLGYKFFDQLVTKNSDRKKYSVCVGTKAPTLDPAANSDASTGLILENVLVGAKKYYKDKEAKNSEGEDPMAKLGEGCCTVTKKIVTCKDDKKTKHGFIAFEECDDLVAEVEAEVGTKPEDYEGTARYIITIKDGAKWSDDTVEKPRNITAFDFTYAWDRASAIQYGTGKDSVRSQWSNLFDSIRGFNAWNAIGQQETDDVNQWDDETKKNWNNLSDSEKYQWKQAYTNEIRKKQTRGGLAGVIPDKNNKQFIVQLINNSEAFEEQLAFTAFMPVPTHRIIKERDPQGRVINENADWWCSADTFPTNGPLKFTKIDNTNVGSFVVNRNNKWLKNNETTVEEITFRLIDDDSAAYNIYKSNEMQMIDMVAQGVLDQVKKTKDWHSVDQIGLYYALFNVNDNTFDDSPNTSEETRQKYRRILSLLINRYGLCQNIVKSGATPANGVVSEGITEKYVPTWSEEKHAIVTKTIDGKPVEEGGIPVEKDWHERNTDMYSHLIKPEPDYVDYRLQNRDDPTKHGQGGFYRIAQTAEDEKQACIDNIKEARQIAETIPGLQIVDDANGWHFTNFPRVNLMTNTGTGHESIFEFMQYYYSLFGISMSIETQEWNSFTAAKRSGGFALARNGWLADYNDPRTYLDIFRSDDPNNDAQLGKNSEHRSR